MERCPICRARLKRAGACRRCGTDLSLPWEIEQQALLLEMTAVHRMISGKSVQAKKALEHALRLKGSPLARALLTYLQK